jgi:hypothetical protein
LIRLSCYNGGSTFTKQVGVSVKLAWEFAGNYVHRRIQIEQAQTVKCPECNEIITHVNYINADIDGDGNLERYPLFDEALEG